MALFKTRTLVRVLDLRHKSLIKYITSFSAVVSKMETAALLIKTTVSY